MVSDNRAATFADNVRVRHFLGVANVGNVIDDVVGIFLESVVGGTDKGGAAAIVIDTQTATHIEKLDLKAHFIQLGINAGGFLDRFFDDKNLGRWGADMEVEQLEAMAEIFISQHLHGSENFCRAEAELGIFPTAFGPSATALAEKPGANADEWLDRSEERRVG